MDLSPEELAEYGNVRQALQSYDPTLRLVYNPRTDRWIVVQKLDTLTHMCTSLVGVRGLPDSVMGKTHYKYLFRLETPTGEKDEPGMWVLDHVAAHVFRESERPRLKDEAERRKRAKQEAAIVRMKAAQNFAREMRLYVKHGRRHFVTTGLAALGAARTGS